MDYFQQIETALGAEQGAAAADLAGRVLDASDYADEDVNAIATAVSRQYRAMHTHAVHLFREKLSGELSAPVIHKLFAGVQADMDAAQAWNRRLDEMATERLANGLIDKIKSNDMREAEEAAVTLIMGTPPEFRVQRARYIGNLLGGLIHEKERAQALVRSIAKNPQKFGIDPVSATDVEEEFQRGSAAVARREASAQVSNSRVQLTEAIVELQRSLPGRNVLHEPNVGEVENFDRQMRAIIRCCLMSPQYDKFNEATMLIVEFSPKEVSTAGAMAGVEQRLYATLGRTARAVANRVLRQVGSDERVFPAYMDFAASHMDQKIGRYCVETFGVFQNPAAVPFLKKALTTSAWNARTEAIFALGNVGSAEALDDLMDLLGQSVKAKVIVGDDRRQAFTLISALGRAVRSVSDVHARGKIITQAIKILPKEDMEFPVRAVLNFFSGKLEGLDTNLLKWAAQVGVTALWSADRPELARAGQNQTLGFRQPLIDLLGRLAPYALGTINESALKYARNYSGAYLAMGEFYGLHPDPSEVPVIRQLLFNTAMHDDSRKSEYTKTTILDTATDQKTEMTKDKVVASLAFALNRIDSPEAHALMGELHDQIQSGQLPAAGPETADILMRAYMKAKRESGQATMAPGTAGSGAAASGHEPGEIHPTVISEEDLANIAALEARYLMAGKKRARKVAAMAALAQKKIVAALKVLIPHLTDSDSIIAAATHTALMDYAQGAPPVVMNALVDDLLESIEKGDNPLKVKVADFLLGLGPNRSPAKEKIERMLARQDLPVAARSVLMRLGQSAGSAGGPPKAAVEIDPDKLGAAGKFMPNAGAAAKGEAVITELDKKRAYMQARQEWIKSGKRGPEPKPPE
jgi:HEAT repeat protein